MDGFDEENGHREGARGEVGAERHRVAALAGELRRRAQPDYVKTQARRAMIRKTTNMKNHAVRSPVVMGIAGAALGIAAARLIRGATSYQRRERVEWEPVPETESEFGFGTDGGRGASLRERAGEVTEGIKDKAAELKDSLGERASELKGRAVDAARSVEDRVERGVALVREKMPSAEQVKDRMGDAWRFGTAEQPILGGLLAAGVGMALGFLLPSTEQEERIVAPLRQRAADNLGQLGDKVHEVADDLDDRITGSREET